MSADDSENLCEDGVFSNQYDCYVKGGSISTGTWRHVAITKYNRTIKFYVDGSLVSTKTQCRTNIVYNGEATRRYIGNSDDS
jgi:hypothetical protein